MVVGKQTLKNYECKTLEDYYTLIIESEINGHNQQMRDYFNKLDREQKKDFIRYLKEMEIKNINFEDLL